MTRDEIEAAYVRWITETAPSTDDACEAWETLDGGDTQDRFRAAVRDAFLGGWDALQARLAEAERSGIDGWTKAEMQQARAERAERQRDEARAALREIDAMFPPRLPPAHPASIHARIRKVTDAALRGGEVARGE